MTRPLAADRPPSEFVGEDRIRWNRVVRVLKAQRLWEPTDADLVSAYTEACRRSRVGRVVGRPDLDAERDALTLADALLLTPAARRRAGMNPRVPTGGAHFEAGSSISGVV
jgi:phage terminase small subunit